MTGDRCPSEDTCMQNLMTTETNSQAGSGLARGFRHPSSVIRQPMAAIVLIALIAGCGRPPAEEKPGGAAPGAEIVSASLVNVEPAQTRTIQKTMEVTGNLVALQDVLVGAQGGGKLAAVRVQEGDSVSAGQVVAVMDTVDLAAQVQQQQANVQAALNREQQARVVLTPTRNALHGARTQPAWPDKTTANAVRQARSGIDLTQQRLAVVKAGARGQERAQAEE